MILPLLSAFAFGFGAIASKRSEDGEERAGVRSVVPTHHRAIAGTTISTTRFEPKPSASPIVRPNWFAQSAFLHTLLA